VAEFEHKSVMVDEVINAMRPRASGFYADGTVGGGGHARAILIASSPDGRLLGCDRDEEALRAAGARLAPFAGRFELRHGSFRELNQWTAEQSCDGIFLDLGVSSPQLDHGDRGFSFQKDGPLDMRMDRAQPLTARTVVNEWPVEDLATIFFKYGEDRNGRRLARAIEKRRTVRPIQTTGELASLIEEETPRRGARTHPATKVFQALRIAVNDELAQLEEGLVVCWRLLKKGGRLIVLTFHSLEDRLVKNFGRNLERDYWYEGAVDVPELRKPKAPELRWLNRKAIIPSEAEQKENPRARSAQLRAMEKIGP
jgi:16S rRNA (cytosine1402-N4)-methyltransferase